jgi:hypothetical protein
MKYVNPANMEEKEWEAISVNDAVRSDPTRSAKSRNGKNKTAII